LIVSDLSNNNLTIANISTSINKRSPTNTSCGYVYQFQYKISNNNKILQQLLLTFNVPNGSPTQWYISNFRAEAGCSGFTVGSACDVCLAGFYSAYTLDDFNNGCIPCPIVCATCTNQGKCLSCSNYTTSTTNGCLYPSTYGIYYFEDGFTHTGNYTQQQSPFNHSVQSINKTVSISLQLSTNQSYLVKFYLLYPKDYSKTNFTLTVNGLPWNSTASPTDKSTLSSLNGGQ
jgi:hypothetical protein